jgi:hypothetical protein
MSRILSKEEQDNFVELWLIPNPEDIDKIERLDDGNYIIYMIGHIENIDVTLSVGTLKECLN